MIGTCRICVNDVVRLLNGKAIGQIALNANALRCLENHGCHQAQGFWFSEPLPASEFAQWYRARKEHTAAEQSG